MDQDEKKKNANMALWICCTIGVLILIFLMIFAATNPNNNTMGGATENDSAVVSSVADVDSAIAAVDEKEKQIDEKAWGFHEEKDEMHGGNNVWATLESDDYATFDFPYDGGSSLTITVRYMKKYGNDVILNISKGQFGGNEYEGTNYVTVRFDGGSPHRYYFNEPDDGSSDQIFIVKKGGFISNLESSKKIIIEAPFYQSGCHIFHFHCDKKLIWRH